MNAHKAQPVYHPDNNDLLGYVLQRDQTWLALNLFGYPLATTDAQKTAIQTVTTLGIPSLKDIWQYYDEVQAGWFDCKIVTVAQDSLDLRITDTSHPKISQVITLLNPSVRTIRKKL